METQHYSNGSVLRIAGGFIAIFSLVMGLLVLFVIPGACSFLGGLELIILAFLFIGGGLTYGIGEVLSRKKGKVEAKPVGTP